MPSTAAGDGRISYAEYGRRGGKPLFYFHGWPGSRLQVRPADDSAQELGIHIIAPDRPGMGRSEFDPERRLLDWPPVVSTLADRLGWDRFSVLGVSGGAPYALACAVRIPDRLNGVGICSGVPHSNWLRVASSPWMLQRAVALEDRTPGSLLTALGLLRTYIRIMPGSSFLRPALLTLSKADRRVFRRRDAMNAVADSIREAFHGPSRGLYYDLRLLISDWGFTPADLQFPVNWWHGTHDAVCDLSEIRAIAARHPFLSLTICNGEGHYSLPIDRMRQVLQRLR